MRRWSRSFATLAVVFSSTVAITVVLTVLVVRDRAPTTADATPTSPATIAVGTAPTGTGGSLAVSGDLEGPFILDRDAYEVSVEPDFERGFARVVLGRFSLLGERGAVHIGYDSLEVEQVDIDDLAFYPEPGDCSITAGTLNAAVGVASASLRCPELTDIRDNGEVALDGAIALPADMLGMRGDLPPAGGEVQVGGSTLAFSDARMLIQDAVVVETGRQPLFLFADDDASSLGFEREPETGDLYLTYLVIDEEPFDIPDDACQLEAAELGPLNPITTVTQLLIRCDELDLGNRGVVAIDATLVIDLIIESEAVAARP
jgi:hypothetical protein